jgi:hypothetical protein
VTDLAGVSPLRHDHDGDGWTDAERLARRAARITTLEDANRKLSALADDAIARLHEMGDHEYADGLQSRSDAF